MTNPTPVRLIFVGLKGINQWHYLPATRISDAVTLVAGVDPAPAARDQFHEKSGVPVYESLKDACSKHGAEGVVIGTPNPVHIVNIRAAAKAGLHMSVTKPLCNTVAECREAIQLAEENNLVLQTSHEYRFRPSMERAFQLVAKGALGDVSLVTAHMGHKGGLGKLTAQGSWRSDPANVPGGCLNLLGVHMFDLCNRLLGRPVAVSATLKKLLAQAPLEDTVVAVAEYAAGPLAVITSSYVSAPSDFVHVFGTEKNLLVTDSAVFTEEARNWREMADLPRAGSAQVVLEQFAAAIRGGRTPETSGETGMIAVAMNHAAVISQQEGGRQVRLSEVLGE